MNSYFEPNNPNIVNKTIQFIMTYTLILQL